MIINAENLILGRMATFVAKKALQGEEIIIINCEKAVVIGKRQNVLSIYKVKKKVRDVFKGPFFPRRPELIVKRTIRGMLPYKQPKGREAVKRIKCYQGIPTGLKDKTYETIDNAKLAEDKIKFLTIAKISEQIGHKT